MANKCATPRTCEYHGCDGSCLGEKGPFIKAAATAIELEMPAPSPMLSREIAIAVINAVWPLIEKRMHQQQQLDADWM